MAAPYPTPIVRRYALTPDNLLNFLDCVDFGVCVTDWSGNIVFWNFGAEQILSYPTREIVGLTCPELICGIAEEASLLLDLKKQQMLRMEEGYLPEPFAWRLRSSAGGIKMFRVTPVVVPGLSQRGSLVLYLFGELPTPSYGLVRGGGDGEKFLRVRSLGGAVDFENVAIPATGPTPTQRELEVLRLVSSGMNVADIGDELHLSVHTVLNHIRNARRKLGARTRMDAVLTAMRRGLF